MASGSLEKVENDINGVDDIKDHLDVLHFALIRSFRAVQARDLIVLLVDFRKDKHEWRDEQVVDNDAGYHEVPELAWLTILLDQVPARLVILILFLLNLLVVLLLELKGVVLHGLLLQLFKPRLQHDLFAVQPNNIPQFIKSLLLFLWTQL